VQRLAFRGDRGEGGRGAGPGSCAGRFAEAMRTTVRSPRPRRSRTCALTEWARSPSGTTSTFAAGARSRRTRSSRVACEARRCGASRARPAARTAPSQAHAAGRAPPDRACRSDVDPQDTSERAQSRCHAREAVDEIGPERTSGRSRTSAGSARAYVSIPPVSPGTR
jgi:hypothetical protein